MGNTEQYPDTPQALHCLLKYRRMLVLFLLMRNDRPRTAGVARKSTPRSNP